MSRILRTIPLLITICLLSFPAEAKYGDGTGEPNDPYRIATAEELILLGDSPEDYDKHFILTADIDLNPNLPGRKVFDKALIAPNTDADTWDWEGGFSGLFDGNGHTISHLTIVGRDYLGLIGSIRNGGEVRNLGVVDANVAGTADYTYVGILAGENWGGSVTDCYGTGTVTGKSNVGGIVGHNYIGDVVNSYSVGSARGIDEIGGLVGANDEGIVINCHSRGTISGDWLVGGLVGNNSGSVINCYTEGTGSGNEGVGGIAGRNEGNMANCYSRGTISGESSVGGLVGENSGSVINSYSTGIVSGSFYAGGLVGHDEGELFGSFCLIETDGLSAGGSGVGLTPAQMMERQTFLDAGWDFLGEIENGLHETWQIPEGGGYPVLSIFNNYQPPLLSGEGTPESPHLISTTAELGSAVYHKPGTCYRLTQDIDLSDITWSIAVIPELGAVFDGDGFTISKLTIVGHNNVGFVGIIQHGGQIWNLGVVDANVVGTGDETGIIVGCSSGSVANSYSTGTVSGSHDVGGIVGYNRFGDVINSYTTGTVLGYRNVGGLIGFNYGDVINSYSAGSVIGDWEDENVGGLVGYSNGSLTNCYSAGSVSGGPYAGGLVGRHNFGSVTNSFWDIEASGTSGSGGGTGLTTALMQTANTFLDAGWDFLGEIENGLHETWQMPESGGYPVLSIFNDNHPTILSGEGTPESPYLISTAIELGSVIYHKQDTCYRLTQDIDLAGITWSIAVIPDIGGVFDGNGFNISNMAISGHDDLGLIRAIRYGGHVCNLSVVDANVVSTGDETGIIVGSNSGSVTNCYSGGAVNGDDKIGGLVGMNGYGSSITTSYSTGTVSGDVGVGGLVGMNGYGSSIATSYSTGTVSGNSEVGGIVGSNSYGSITTSYSTGTVSGNSEVGGLVGRNGDGSITTSYSAGTVSGEHRVGGLIGFNYGDVINSYSIGSVSGDEDVGGLVGKNHLEYRTVTDSLWDIQTSGQATSAGGIGKITAEMQTVSTFLEVGWDFVDETANGTEDIWWILEGQGYPRLWWEPILEN